MRLVSLAIVLALGCVASAESYFFGVGINDYATPRDQSGNPLKDDDGNVLSFDLKGCVPDVHFYQTFFEHAGVKPENSVLLTDGHANGANFIAKLREVVSKLNPGDHLYFAYSGHGTQIEGGNEPDKKEEYIVLQDFVLVHDDLFKELADILRGEGVDATFIFDSCFSGGMSMDVPAYKKVMRKSISMKGVKGARKAQTAHGRQLVKAGGKLKKMRSDGQTLFLFACREDQTSADLVLQDGTAHGAFTMFLEDVLRDNPDISAADALAKVNDLLQQSDLAQRAITDASTPDRVRRRIPG